MQHDQGENPRYRPRAKHGYRRAVYPHAEPYEDICDRDVDYIGKRRREHGRAVVSRRPHDADAGRAKPDEWVADTAKEKVYACRFQHVCFRAFIERGEHVFSAKDHRQAEHSRRQHTDQDSLHCELARVTGGFRADFLRDDDGRPGCERGEYRHDRLVYRVNQGHAADREVAHARYHNCRYHADKC